MAWTGRSRMAKKRKALRPEPSSKCFSVGATVGHMLALSGEAHQAIRSGNQIQAHQAFDTLEFEAKEFDRLMGRRLDPDDRKASKRIRSVSKGLMKELDHSTLEPLAIGKREPLGRKALEMIHDVRSLLKAGNSVCGNFPVEELRAKPFPKGR